MLTATGFLLQSRANKALQLRGSCALWAALASCQHTICITDKGQKGTGKICLSLKITSRWEGATPHPNYNLSHSVLWVKSTEIHHTGFRCLEVGYPSPPQLSQSPKRGKSRFSLGENSTLWRHYLLSKGIIAPQGLLERKQKGQDSGTEPQPREGSNWDSSTQNSLRSPQRPLWEAAVAIQILEKVLLVTTT